MQTGLQRGRDLVQVGLGRCADGDTVGLGFERHSREPMRQLRVRGRGDPEQMQCAVAYYFIFATNPNQTVTAFVQRWRSVDHY